MIEVLRQWVWESGALVAGVCLVLGFWFTNRIAMRVQLETRAGEMPDNEDIPPPSNSAIMWTVVHIRDDLSGVFVMLGITNGLLAAILGVVLFKW